MRKGVNAFRQKGAVKSWGVQLNLIYLQMRDGDMQSWRSKAVRVEELRHPSGLDHVWMLDGAKKTMRASTFRLFRLQREGR